MQTFKLYFFCSSSFSLNTSNHFMHTYIHLLRAKLVVLLCGRISYRYSDYDHSDAFSKKAAVSLASLTTSNTVSRM